MKWNVRFACLFIDIDWNWPADIVARRNAQEMYLDNENRQITVKYHIIGLRIQYHRFHENYARVFGNKPFVLSSLK